MTAVKLYGVKELHPRWLVLREVVKAFADPADVLRSAPKRWVIGSAASLPAPIRRATRAPSHRAMATGAA